MSKVHRVLVVGGGIGGLCAAIALLNKGVEVEVIEKNAEWTVYGVGIIQQANVVRAMAGLGILESYLDVAFGFDTTAMYDAAGVKLADIPTPRLDARYPATMGVSRRALHKVLVDGVRSRGGLIRLGVTVSDLQQTDRSVAVTFSDGTSGSYDLVVGADGLYSQIRAQLWGDAHEPQFVGQGCWRYNFPRAPDVDCIRIVRGPNGNAGLVPLGEDLMYLFLTSIEPGNPRLPSDQLDRLYQERLLADFGGFVADYARQITVAEEVVYRPLEAVFVPGPWFKGRVVLIGDAAHGTTPHLAQGAGMAIEDAVVLADEVAKHLPVEMQLQAFMARRYERAKLISDTSLQLSQWEVERAHADLSAIMTTIGRKIAEPI